MPLQSLPLNTRISKHVFNIATAYSRRAGCPECCPKLKTYGDFAQRAYNSSPSSHLIHPLFLTLTLSLSLGLGSSHGPLNNMHEIQMSNQARHRNHGPASRRGPPRRQQQPILNVKWGQHEYEYSDEEKFATVIVVGDFDRNVILHYSTSSVHCLRPRLRLRHRCRARKRVGILMLWS